MRTIQREIVSALIISSDGKMLYGMKDPRGGGVYADCWHLPGGGMDPGETQIDTLRREAMEEVGVDVTHGKISLFDDKGHGSAEKRLKETGEVVLCQMHFTVYRVDMPLPADQIAVKLSDDLVTHAWVTKDELLELKQMQAGIELFQRLGWRA